MTPRSPSPPLIKGNDGIVSRPPNEVNYSTLKGKNMKTGKQLESEIRPDFKRFGIFGKIVDIYMKQKKMPANKIFDRTSQWIRIPRKKDVKPYGKEGGVTGELQGNKTRRKFRKFGLKKMERNMKEGKYTGKINLTVPGNENKNTMMTTIVEYDEGEDRETEEPQPKKCEHPMSNTDTTNDNTCNSCTSAGRNIDNGKVTNTETKSVTTNDEGNKGEESEAEAEAEADTNSEDLNSSNTGIDRSNSKSNSVDTKILKPPDKNKNKMIGNNVGFNEDNSSENRELQQQKCENAMSIAVIVNDMKEIPHSITSSGKSEINISTITIDE